MIEVHELLYNATIFGESGVYRFDCVPQDAWNQITGDMRRAVEHGEDFEPAMQA